MRKGWTASSEIQVVALSATVSQPAEIVDAFLPAGRIVAVGGGRRTDIVSTGIERPSDHATERALPAYLMNQGEPEKVLVFARQPSARRSPGEYVAHEPGPIQLPGRIAPWQPGQVGPGAH